MPPLNTTSDHNQENHGWPAHQNLVLSELERHEGKQDKLQEALVALKMEVVSLRVEQTQKKDFLINLCEKIETLSAQLRESDKKYSEQEKDITLIKYKIGVFATAVSSGLTLIVQVIIKMLQSPTGPTP